MSKIDEKITVLPDIEMYGGNYDEWVIQLYKPSGARYTYEELVNQNCTFTLIIKDYGYIHRTNGTTGFSLTKTGTLGADDDTVSAVASFTLNTGDTVNVYGKFIYQVEVICGGTKQAAQGNLYIYKNINQ